MSRTVIGQAIVWVMLAAAIVGARSASADGFARVLPSAGAATARPANPAPASHGWFVSIDRPGHVTLAHVPPRRRAGADGLLRGAADGVVRHALELDGMPSAIAAWDDRIYLVFAARGSGTRSVSSLAVRPTPARDRWRLEPLGRLAVEPELPGGGELEGLAATSVGLVSVIVEPDANGVVQRRLRVLEGRAWREARLPDSLAVARPDVAVFAIGMGERLGLFIRGTDGSAELWSTARVRPPGRSARAEWSADAEQESSVDDETASVTSGPLGLEWHHLALASDCSVPELPGDGSRVFVSGGRVYAAVATAGDAINVLAITPETCVKVGRIDGVGERAAVVGLDTPSRVVAAWLVDVANPKGALERPVPRMEIREISLVDGRTEYSGPIVGDAPISPREAQWLALGLVVLMGAVLLVVLRADSGKDDYTIPVGTSLAPSGRRVIAGAIDLVTAGVVAARSIGVSGAELADPVFLMSERSVVFVGTMIGIGVMLGVIGEVFMGRSPGKLLTSCEVIDVRVTGRLSHPRLWQAVVRNLVKWVLCPAALLGLMEPQGRHRGDSLSRTAVVVADGSDESEADA